MCRLAGSVNIDRSWVESALEHQKSGGPDHTGIHSIGNVTFGHNRLAIIDLSEDSNQPLQLLNWKLFTYNGEIYSFDSSLYNSDTKHAFSLLCQLGVKSSLTSFNGMFAFGFYDHFDKEIHLAVDRFGQKPLYYYHEGDKFAFASTPAALYALKDKWELDRDALQSYWLLGSVMGESGLFKGIKKLCAAEHLVYDIQANTVKAQRYWEPSFQEKATVPDLKDMVIDTIRKVKVSDVPIHVFLSGGIDSTLVASQFEGGKAIHLDGPERQYAQFVADKFNIDLKVITPDDVDTEEAIMDYVFKSGEPTMAGIIPWIVSRETAKYGKVAISANGADELFFGYDRTHENCTQKQTNHIFRNYFSGPPILRYQDLRIGDGRAMELRTYVEYDLNKTLDFASMCHGLEVRSPFLDHRLVEMALSIPESEHRKPHNKTILKEMLAEMGFTQNFLNRPKQGFSLFKQPKNLENCINLAWEWVQKEGYLDLRGIKLTSRDRKYLEMSALGFYYWHQTWKHKIK